MSEPTDADIFEAVRAGDDAAFEGVYDRYHQRARVLAWRVSHRGDWVDDLLNEAWCRAFSSRDKYDPARPFLVWFGGILQNVYREHCRQSPTTLGGTGSGPDALEGGIDAINPEKIASEAELLVALNDCVEALDEESARLVRLRFFENKTLRAVAKEVMIPEATLRERKLPAVFRRLKACLDKKGIDSSQLFPAQLSDVLQYRDEDAE